MPHKIDQWSIICRYSLAPVRDRIFRLRSAGIRPAKWIGPILYVGMSDQLLLPYFVVIHHFKWSFSTTSSCIDGYQYFRALRCLSKLDSYRLLPSYGIEIAYPSLRAAYHPLKNLPLSNRGIAMATVNVIIVRAFEFLFFVLFTYLILVYGGILLLLPLDLVVQMIHALSFVFGNHGFLYAFFAVAAVAALAYRIYKMPVLWKAILDTGYGLARLGYEQNRHFEAMIRSFGDDDDTSAPDQDQK